jgi:hypothetical protein
LAAISPTALQNLKPCPENPAGDHDLLLIGQTVDHEVFVRRVRKQAG